MEYYEIIPYLLNGKKVKNKTTKRFVYTDDHCLTLKNLKGEVLDYPIWKRFLDPTWEVKNNV